MVDAGRFDPLIRQVPRFAHNDPARIAVGTAALTMCVALRGRCLHGVLTGSKMIPEMAEALVSVVPDSFGVLPVLAHTAEGFGSEQAEVARAAILGRMTTGFPLSPLTASTFILVGMSGVQLGEHQRFIFRWAFATTLVMTAVALLTGAISL